MTSQSRRKLGKQRTFFAFETPAFSTLISRNYPFKNMPCSLNDTHFQKVENWVNWKQTTNTLKIGNREKAVKIIVMAWKINVKTIKKTKPLVDRIHDFLEWIFKNRHSQHRSKYINKNSQCSMFTIFRKTCSYQIIR